MANRIETGLQIKGFSGDTNALQVTGNSLINGDVNITGNVNVIGTATTLNTQVVQTRDNRILLNYSGTSLTAVGGGIEVLSAKTDGTNSQFITDSSGDWNTNVNLNVSGKTKTTTFQLTSSPTPGYVLTSDASGNGTWIPSYSFTGGTVGGQTTFSNGLSATTISATTYYGSGANLTGIPDNYVTGGTYSSGSLTLNRQNGSVTINGLVSGDTNFANTDLTFTASRTHNTNGNTLSIEGNSLGTTGFIAVNSARGQVGFNNNKVDCDTSAIEITHSGFPRITVNSGETIVNNSGGNYDFRVEGDTDINLLFVDASTDRVGIGTNTPTELFDVDGKTKTTTLQITSGAVNNYVLTSDASGNAAWEPVTNSGAITGITINNNTNNYLLTAIGTANIINGESGARFDGVTLDLSKSSTSPNIIISDAGSTTTDAYIRIEGTSAGTPTYAIGVDKSDLNKFKITYANNSTASMSSTKLFDIDYNGGNIEYNLAYDSVFFATASDAGQIKLKDNSSNVETALTQYTNAAVLNANNGDTGAQAFYINNDSVSGWTSFGGGGVNDLMYLVNENRGDLPGITGGNGLYIKHDLSVNGLVRVGDVTGTGVAVYRNASTGILTTTSSDERVKQNITQITGATGIIQNLRGVYYNWKNTEHFQTDDESRQIGLIAQEVEPHLPEAVVLNGISDYKTIKYSEMVSVLVEAVKEQQDMISDLKQEIENLKTRVTNLGG